MSRKGKQRQKRREQRRCVLYNREIRHPAESAAMGLTRYMICRSCLRMAKKVAEVEGLKLKDRDAARIAGLPFIHFDAATLSEAGQQGRDADEMVKDLFAATKDDKKAAYGMEPELMSRITQRVALELQGWTDMKRILWEAKTSVFHQQQAFFLEQGIQLQLPSKWVEQLIDEALALGTGSRGLQTAVENMVQPLLFHLAERRNAEADTWAIEGSA